MMNSTTTSPPTTFALSREQVSFAAKMRRYGVFKLFTFFQLPLAFFGGLRIKTLEQGRCQTTVPYRWITKNPFHSTYFAALSMAAELSTGALALLAVHGKKPTVAVIIVKIEGEFLKKAADLTTFTCEDGDKIFAAANRAYEGGEPVEATATTVGVNKAGEEVARFQLSWSFKRRQS